MRGRDRNEPGGAEQAGAFGDDAHRHASAILAGGDRLFLQTEGKTHDSTLRMVMEVGLL